jgi:8-oxo-dGTP diphosphatase
MSKTPKTGLGVIIMKNDEVLLGKRIGSHGENTWSFPGGHIEMFEDFSECAKRETKEETGLDIKLIYEPQLHYTRDKFKNEKKDYFTFYQKAKYIGGIPKIMEPNKCLEWKWFRWDNLPKPLFLPIENLIKQKYNPFK